jgi:DNA processing protein
VIEADEKSGALLTAKFAVEQNRDVYAVPGSIFAQNSSGTNQLIKDGAKLVSSAGDVLEELDVAAVEQQLEMRELLPLDEREAKIVSLLAAEPLHFDEICRESGLAASDVGATLTLLELKGLARGVGGASYVSGR